MPFSLNQRLEAWGNSWPRSQQIRKIPLPSPRKHIKTPSTNRYVRTTEMEEFLGKPQPGSVTLPHTDDVVQIRSEQIRNSYTPSLSLKPHDSARLV